jgi:threonylcarbamoyladenosine tRNA methylthiotransferase MtaB
MTTFQLHNFGCRASQADGASLKKQLLLAGLEQVHPEQASDVVILNTCTVTAAADAEVRQVIRRIYRQDSQCRILVTGCYAQRAPDEISRLPGVSWVVGNSHKHLVADLLREGTERGGQCPEPASGGELKLVQISDAGAHNSAEVRVGEISEEFHFAPVFPDDRTRPTLKVQDGCNARCSFCIIPAVRGRSRSLAPESVVEQVRQLEQQGYKEIVLSGINLGSYGRDRGRTISFLGLLEEILSSTSMPRVRISSIEPMDVGAPLIRLVAGETRLARHLHVPLQSGCDRILRQMNRRYWAPQYAERILTIREQIPDCGIGADVMVGFPGETDTDHAASVRFIESLPFTYLHIFPYSPRPGTPAAARPDQVNREVVRRRSEEIRAVIRAKRQAFLAAQVGRTLSALTLDETEEGSRLALSSNYLKIVLPASPLAPNTLVDVRVGRAHEGLLYGCEKTSAKPAMDPLQREITVPRQHQSEAAFARHTTYPSPDRAGPTAQACVISRGSSGASGGGGESTRGVHTR